MKKSVGELRSSMPQAEFRRWYIYYQKQAREMEMESQND